MGIPDRNNPCAYIRWICDHIVDHPSIFIVVLKDDASRTLILRNEARRLSAPYLTCRPLRSQREFLLFMAEELGISVHRSRGFDLWNTIKNAISTYPAMMLDNAEHLARHDLRAILSFHKHGEGTARGQVPFVLASGQRQLLLNIEATDLGGFIGHTIWYYPGCEPGKKLRECNEKIEEMNLMFDSPIISLPRQSDVYPSNDQFEK